MRRNAKNKRHSFFTVVFACFFLFAFVSPIAECLAGSIVAWRWDSQVECVESNVPAPNTNFTAIAASYGHSLGLKADGSIVAWGNNRYGECNVPAPNANFIAISAAENHSMGLKSDGSIIVWGDNQDGLFNVPQPNTGFIAISAGSSNALGLKQDGSIVAWGVNWQGECNVPEPNTGFIAISAGVVHSLGLKADGSIAAWGKNDIGQCNVPEPNTGFIAIAAGRDYSLGLKADGSIVAWGGNHSGQCDVPSPNTGFTAIATGMYHSFGLKADGSVVVWGGYDIGLFSPNPVPGPNMDFMTLSTKTDFVLGLKNYDIDIPITAKSCTIKNGRDDYFAFNGLADINAERIAEANYWDVNISSDTNVIYHEKIASSLFTHKNNIYQHKHTSRINDTNAISMISYDVRKGTLKIIAPKINLTGLKCPVFLRLTIGGHNGIVEIGEDIVNGKRFIPIQLMSGYGNDLRVHSIKIKIGGDPFSYSDSLKIKGEIACKNIPGSMSDVVLTVGSGPPLTIPAESFKQKRNNVVAYECKNGVVPIGDMPFLPVGGLASAIFDFAKCSFVINIKNTNILYQDWTFVLDMEDFSKTVDVNFNDWKILY